MTVTGTRLEFNTMLIHWPTKPALDNAFTAGWMAVIGL